MKNKKNAKSEVPTVVEESLPPARISENELNKARHTAETHIRYIRNTPGGHTFEGQVLPKGVVGKPQSLKTEWTKFIDDQKITEEFDGNLQSRPDSDFKVRAEMVLLTSGNYLLAVSFPETSYIHNLSPFLTEIAKEGLELSDLLVRTWCEKRTGKDRTYPSVKIQIFKGKEGGGDGD